MGLKAACRVSLKTNEQLCLAYFVYSVTRQPQARNAHLPLALISILLLFNVFIVLITSTLFHYGHNHQTCPIPHYYISSLPLQRAGTSMKRVCACVCVCVCVCKCVCVRVCVCVCVCV